MMTVPTLSIVPSWKALVPYQKARPNAPYRPKNWLWLVNIGKFGLHKTHHKAKLDCYQG